MTVTVKTAPPVEPVTLEEARDHLRLTATGVPASHPDDAFIKRLIQGARENAEQYMRRSIIETEFEWKFDDFPDHNAALTFPRDPVLSVESVIYSDDDNNPQSLIEFTERFSDSYSYIVPSYQSDWPTARGHDGDVTVTFKAGYEATGSPLDYKASVPESIKHAILLLVGHMYENREQVITGSITTEMKFGYERLLWPHRVLKF